MALLTRAIESELQAMRASYGEEDPIAQEVRAARSKEAMPASVHRLSHILTSPTPTHHSTRRSSGSTKTSCVRSSASTPPRSTRSSPRRRSPTRRRRVLAHTARRDSDERRPWLDSTRLRRRTCRAARKSARSRSSGWMREWSRWRRRPSRRAPKMAAPQRRCVQALLRRAQRATRIEDECQSEVLTTAPPPGVLSQ